jgi:thioredoxin-related protein
MKFFLFAFAFAFLLLLNLAGNAQDTKLYNPYANAAKDLSDAVKKAKAEKKHVLIQAGGNWCSWCIIFNRFSKSESQVDSILNSDFIIYHLNYSPENKNAALMAKYGYPQRFGFPVFLILDENGNRIHTQNSSYLEQGRTYNKNKVIEFLQQWNKKSIDPIGYKKF